MSQELTIIDEDKEYFFTIAPRVEENASGVRGKLYLIQTKDWEPADGAVPWRRALHPWIGGLGPHRLNPSVTLGGDLKNRPSMVYSKGNLDASYDGFATFPPEYTDVETDVDTNLSTYFNSAAQLYYGGAQYGNITYMGPGSTLSDLGIAVRNFNGKAYLAGGQYLFSVPISHDALDVVKDFGPGKTVYDIEPFNDELVIAMGETEKIWTMDTSEAFTQATDATYAIALGRTNELLWRAESSNKISSCITSPRTLTSWSPASPNQYTAGDTTYSITDLVEYGGSIAAMRPDGAFLADGETNFHNQTPDLITYPHVDNGKHSFTAWGFLWIPSIIGLIRMAIGEAPIVGPELSQRPDFRFRIHSGVPWNGAIYLVCSDYQADSELFVCKMTRDNSGVTKNPYVYHEWCRLGTTDPGTVAIVTTNATNPYLIVGKGEGIAVIALGQGSGPDIDSDSYYYGTSMVVEPGLIIASEDLGIVIDVVGVKVVARQVDGGTITVSLDMDGEGTWKELKSTVDGPGVAAISESGWITATRYAEPNTIGRAPYFKVEATMPAGQFGNDRTDIFEIWAFGNAHPDSTELITVDLYSDLKARVRGLIQGRQHNNFRLLRDLAETNKTFEIKIPGYDNDQRVRVQIQEITESNTSMRLSGENYQPSNTTRLVFRRIDFSGDLDA